MFALSAGLGALFHCVCLCPSTSSCSCRSPCVELCSLRGAVLLRQVVVLPMALLVPLDLGAGLVPASGSTRGRVHAHVHVSDCVRAPVAHLFLASALQSAHSSVSARTAAPARVVARPRGREPASDHDHGRGPALAPAPARRMASLCIHAHGQVLATCSPAVQWACYCRFSCAWLGSCCCCSPILALLLFATLACFCLTMIMGLLCSRFTSCSPSSHDHCRVWTGTGWRYCVRS